MSESSRAFEVNVPSSSAGESVPRTGGVQGRGKKPNGNGGGGGSVPFHRLFAFADGADAALMLLGTLGAVANGAALPFMTVLFGRLIDAFGAAVAARDVVGRVSAVSLQFIYLAIASAVASFVQVTCWMITGERQAARIRNLYLKTILRQEIAFFDRYTSTGEVVGRMSGDTVLIQDAMGEKVGKFIQLLVTFLGGFAVAFAQGWLLALVMLATIPPLVLAGAVMSNVVARMASLGQAAYADAAVVVEQTIGAIRTVASFTGERRAVEKYSRSLRRAYSSGVREGLAAGVGMGTVMVLLFCGYSLGIWYGAKLILEKGYTGARVMNVIFAVLTGSLKTAGIWHVGRGAWSSAIWRAEAARGDRSCHCKGPQDPSA